MNSHINLPDKIKLHGYGKIVEFYLTDKRQIKYYGKTETSNESLWRTEILKDNEVFYQSQWGWGVFVNTDTMETISYDATEWGGQKIMKIDKALKITDRQVGHLREEISRVQRQIKLIKEGKTHVDGKDRMDIIVDCCKEIDRVLCKI